MRSAIISTAGLTVSWCIISLVRFSLRDLLPPPKNISKMSIARKRRRDVECMKKIKVLESREGESEGMKIHMKTQVYDVITIKAHHHQNTAISVTCAIIPTLGMSHTIKLAITSYFTPFEL